MATIARNKTQNTLRGKSSTAIPQEPRKLSKFALWRKENPNGILVVKDWRAVNK
jgi:hypothetical protein